MLSQPLRASDAPSGLNTLCGDSEQSQVTTDELKRLFGAPISPKWVFVLIGGRLFHRLNTTTFHEYPSER